MDTIDIITGILIGGTIIYLFVLLIVAQIKYSIVLECAKKVKPDFKENLGGLWVTDKGGGWIASTYHFRTPLPIAIKTKDDELKKLVKAHDQIIKIFWISIITVLPAVIIILNLIN
jgi:hypothetical protein